jgi:hypothetical protein
MEGIHDSKANLRKEKDVIMICICIYHTTLECTCEADLPVINNVTKYLFMNRRLMGGLFKDRMVDILT